jgi:hypothetical protein
MNDLYQYVTTTKVMVEIASSTKNFDLAGWFRQVMDILDVVNGWMYAYIGVTFIKILQWVGGAFIWILQFMVDIIKQGIALL